MNLRRFLSYVLVAALSAAVAFALPRPAGKLAQLDGLITERFVGDSSREDRLDAAARAMISATGDRWSYYMSQEEYALQKEQSANAFVGVGITILKEDKGFRILEITPGSGAEAAGLKADDLMVEVDGQSVREMEITSVRALVTGKEGTAVTLGILRGSQAMTFSAERRNIQTEVATLQMLPQDTALISIRNFDSRCAQETLAAIDSALEQGAKQMIFDVRNNHGGYASEMVQVLDRLLPEGEIFRTLRYDGKEQTDMSDANCLTLPMAVLVNEHSYSAAEFFAAALQEYDAAVIVGEKTVGKGYFQITYGLSDGSAVALSVGKYFTPQGVSLETVGITPDIVSVLTQEQNAALSSGTLSWEDDPNLQQAIQALSRQ